MQNGYIAIISVIVLTAILTVLTITLTASSLNSLQSSRAAAVSNKALNAVEGCTEDALLSLQNNNALPASVVTPALTCTVTLNSHVGNTWDFNIAGSLQGYQKDIQIVAQRDTVISITKWQEQP